MIKNVQVKSSETVALSPPEGSAKDRPGYVIHELFFCNTSAEKTEIIKDSSERFGPNKSGHQVHAHGGLSLTKDHYKFGSSSLFFNSSEHYATVNQSLDWNFGGEEFTVEFWIKFTKEIPSDATQTNGRIPILCSKSWEIYHGVSGAGITAAFKKNSERIYLESSRKLDNGEWYHVAVSRTIRNELVLYVNGIRDAVIHNFGGALDDSNDVLYIGQDKENWFSVADSSYAKTTDALGKFNVCLDDLRISNKEKYNTWSGAVNPTVENIGGATTWSVINATQWMRLQTGHIQLSPAGRDNYNKNLPDKHGIEIKNPNITPNYIDLDKFNIRILYFFDTKDENYSQEFPILTVGPRGSQVDRNFPTFQIVKLSNSHHIGLRVTGADGKISQTSVLAGIGFYNDIVIKCEGRSVSGTSFASEMMASLTVSYYGSGGWWRSSTSPKSLHFATDQELSSGKIDLSQVYIHSASNGKVGGVKISSTDKLGDGGYTVDRDTLTNIFPYPTPYYESSTAGATNHYQHYKIQGFSVTSQLVKDEDTLLLLKAEEIAESEEIIDVYTTFDAGGDIENENLLIKDLKIPAGSTFTIGTEKDDKDPSLYRKSKIILNGGEGLVVKGSNGDLVTLTISYSQYEEDGPVVFEPTPTPTPTLTRPCDNYFKDPNLSKSDLTENVLVGAFTLQVKDARLVDVNDFILIDKGKYKTGASIYIGEYNIVSSVDYCSNTIYLKKALQHDHSSGSTVEILTEAPRVTASTSCMTNTDESPLRECDNKLVTLWDLNWTTVYANSIDIGGIYRVDMDASSCGSSVTGQGWAWLKFEAYDGVKTFDSSKIYIPTLNTGLPEPFFEMSRIKGDTRQQNKCNYTNFRSCYEGYSTRTYVPCVSEPMPTPPEDTPSPTPDVERIYYYICKKCIGGDNVLVRDSSKFFSYPGVNVFLGKAQYTDAGCVEKCYGVGAPAENPSLWGHFNNIFGSNAVANPPRFISNVKAESCAETVCLPTPTPTPTEDPTPTDPPTPTPSSLACTKYNYHSKPASGTVCSECEVGTLHGTLSAPNQNIFQHTATQDCNIHIYVNVCESVEHEANKNYFFTVNGVLKQTKPWENNNDIVEANPSCEKLSKAVYANLRVGANDVVACHVGAHSHLATYHTELEECPEDLCNRTCISEGLTFSSGGVTAASGGNLTCDIGDTIEINWPAGSCDGSSDYKIEVDGYINHLTAQSIANQTSSSRTLSFSHQYPSNYDPASPLHFAEYKVSVKLSPGDKAYLCGSVVVSTPAVGVCRTLAENLTGNSLFAIIWDSDDDLAFKSGDTVSVSSTTGTRKVERVEKITGGYQRPHGQDHLFQYKVWFYYATAFNETLSAGNQICLHKPATNEEPTIKEFTDCVTGESWFVEWHGPSDYFVNRTNKIWYVISKEDQKHHCGTFVGDAVSGATINATWPVNQLNHSNCEACLESFVAKYVAWGCGSEAAGPPPWKVQTRDPNNVLKNNALGPWGTGPNAFGFGAGRYAKGSDGHCYLLKAITTPWGGSDWGNNFAFDITEGFFDDCHCGDYPTGTPTPTPDDPTPTPSSTENDPSCGILEEPYKAGQTWISVRGGDYAWGSIIRIGSETAQVDQIAVADIWCPPPINGLCDGYTVLYLDKPFSVSLAKGSVLCPEEPSPTPTPLATSEPSVEIQETNIDCLQPDYFEANNIGPWTGNRSGYTCTGPTYGNGQWSWYLTYATLQTQTWNSGALKTWKGPLSELKLLSVSGEGVDAVETWQLKVWGWSYCSGEVYSSTSTKKRLDKEISFQIGAGSMKLYFACSTSGAISYAGQRISQGIYI